MHILLMFDQLQVLIWNLAIFYFSTIFYEINFFKNATKYWENV